MAEDLLGGIELWTVGWQRERMHALRPTDLLTAMTTRTIQHDPNRTLAQLVAQMPREELQVVNSVKSVSRF